MEVDANYYTVQTAAEMLSVDDEQVLAWINSGQLKAVNVAKSPAGKRRRWRIPEASIGRFLLSRLHPASIKPTRESAPKRAPVKRYV